MKQNRSNSARTIAIFLVVFALVNIGILMFLKKSGNTSATQSKDSEIDYYVTTSTEEEEESTVETSSPDETSATVSVSKPVLEFDESKVPEITQDDLPNLVEILTAAGALKAEDGNGNDVSDEIKGIYSPDPNTLLRFYVTFIIENSDGQNDTVNSGINVTLTGPIIALKSYKLSVEKDAEFDPEAQILYAIDENGNDISDAVTIKGSVDTATKGSYVLLYQASVDGKIAESYLTVTVK